MKRGFSLRRLAGRPVATLLTGTAVGQVLLLAASPALTRLYSPADFGVLGVTTALSTVVGSIAAMSWERAMLLPRSELLHRAVLMLALVGVGVTTAVTTVVAFTFRIPLAELFGTPVLSSLWWIIPMTSAAIGFQRIVGTSAVRAEAFRLLSARSVLQSTGQLAVNLGLAWLGPIGLLAGTATGRLLGCLAIWRRSGARRQRPLPVRAIRVAASRYRRFPLVTTWSTLLNSAGLQAPALVLTAAFGSAEFGFVALALRVLASPVGLVAEAIGQSFDAAASRTVRERSGDLNRLARRLIAACALAAAPAVIFVVLLAPPVFAAVFGSEWRHAGGAAGILAFAVGAQFVAVPVSRTLALLERQRTQLVWDASRLFASCSVIFGCASAGAGLDATLVAWVSVSVASYAVLVGIILRATTRSDRAVGTSRNRQRRESEPLSTSLPLT